MLDALLLDSVIATSLTWAGAQVDRFGVGGTARALTQEHDRRICVGAPQGRRSVVVAGRLEGKGKGNGENCD